MNQKSKYAHIHEREPRLKEAIIIGRTYSHCGNCGRDASPRDKTHETVIGYFAADLPEDDPQRIGCGVEYKYVTSDYSGENQKEASMAMRPDLEWIDMYPPRPALEPDLRKR